MADEYAQQEIILREAESEPHRILSASEELELARHEIANLKSVLRGNLDLLPNEFSDYSDGCDALNGEALHSALVGEMRNAFKQAAKRQIPLSWQVLVQKAISLIRLIMWSQIYDSRVRQRLLLMKACTEELRTAVTSADFIRVASIVDMIAWLCVSFTRVTT